MKMHSFFQRIGHELRAFRGATAGNVAITFAIASLPIVSSVGFAVDYSHANSVKAALQSALDATAMMLSKEASADTSSQLQTNALKYFTALFTRPEAQSVTITTTYTTSGGTQIVVNGSAQIPTTFLGIVGYNNITVAGSSTVKWGSARLRVALVLDNTGSMGQNGKIGALQTATKNLLTQLSSAATANGDVYVSIIPFVKDVNFRAGNVSATWLDWTDYGYCKNGYNTLGYPYATKSACQAKGYTWTTVSDHSQWTGCAMDRGTSAGPDPANYDTNATAPGSTASTKYAPEYSYDYCPQAAMGLSYNWSAMNTLVNNMTPSGGTNQNIGLQVGWQSLVGGGPFTAPALDPNYVYQQVIIILTDGLNTQDRWYGDGSNPSSQVDVRQQMTCANIKAAGITLYTIQVNTSSDPTSTLLQNCASSSDKFFLLTSSSEIVTTFNTIGTNLSKLYIAK